MSCYLCEPEHVIALVKSAVYFSTVVNHDTRFRWAGEDILPGDFKKYASVAALLSGENAASVRHRYPASKEIGFKFRPREFSAVEKFDPVQVLKSVDCFEYQSCEHPGWEESSARAFCDALRRQCIGALPGYAAACWGTPGTR